MWPEQRQLYDAMHYRNCILKARQKGFSTFIQILGLDTCLWNSNIHAGFIAHTRDDAQSIFRDKIKFAYDRLPDWVKAMVYAEVSNAQELTFSNGSVIRVGTSHRGGTLQYLHVSEFGKIAAKYPEKAREIKTGAFNTIAAGQVIFVESTAEGQSGAFYEMCQASQVQQRQGRGPTQLDFKFHFYPWWTSEEYRLPDAVPIDAAFKRYFAKLEGLGINLDDRQKAWYVSQAGNQNQDMKREYPSYPDEAFEAVIEGAYYGELMAKADTDGRIAKVAFDPAVPVETWWDLGIADLMSIWFVQRVGLNYQCIHYYQNSGEGLAHYAAYLAEKQREWGCVYSHHVWPHDGNARVLDEKGRKKTEIMASLGYEPSVVERGSPDTGIDMSRQILPRCYFDKEECSDGVRAMREYQKEWDENLGTYKSKPLHNWASHGCFTGDTLVLTRTGTYPIKNLPQTGEVLTPCGWKEYVNPRLTLKDAQLVEVMFDGGYTVRCTPDHLFLTDSGWKSAESLTPSTAIQSSLTRSHNILTAACIGFGRKSGTTLAVVKNCIETLGRRLLGLFPRVATFTTETAIRRIIGFQISNAWTPASICPRHGKARAVAIGPSIFQSRRVMPLLNGIGLMQAGFGIVGTPSARRVGLSGGVSLCLARHAARFMTRWSAKVGIPNFIAALRARPLRVASVRRLDSREDVYDLTVPDGHWFSLANGAVVHNSDAFRTGAMFRPPTKWASGVSPAPQLAIV